MRIEDGTVLLISRSTDAECGTLAPLLRKVGVPVLRLDADRVGELSVTVNPAGGIAVDGRTIAPTVIWVRHFSPRAIPAQPETFETMFHRDSWTALIDDLHLLSIPDHIPGHLRQLADACRAGIRVPETVVTTDMAAVARAASWRQVVIKALDRHYIEVAPGKIKWIPPEILDRRSLLSRHTGAPVIVQEWIAHEAEFRVYLVRGEIIAFRISKPSPAALWTRPEEVSVYQVTPPPTVVEAAEQLAECWGLLFGVFDFLLSDGVAVFLEADVKGDWRWFEERAGTYSVTNAVARLLRDLHIDVSGACTPDLITFLAG